MKNKKLKNQNSGITLIALVVTIVVLIILAVISINAVFSENGIIKKAEKAKDYQANAEAKDSEALSSLDEQIANAMAEPSVPDITPTTPAGTVVKAPSTWTTLIGTAISDGNGTAIPLPSGFYYVGGDYDTGLVISDKQGDTLDASGTSMGNQFVWIPVESDATFVRESFGDGTVTIAKNKNEDIIKVFNSSESRVTKIPIMSDYYVTKTSVAAIEYTEPYASGYSDGSGTQETLEYNAMRTKVLQYGGFYIGRFEAGINSIELRTGATVAQTVVSKRGVAPYNYVPWGASMSDASEVEGASGAVYLAKSMYQNSESVTSTLCYGVQWDAMCKYIEDYTRTTDRKDAPELTGSVSTDVSKRIYDLAGNCHEWTMEANGENRVLRGGFYYGASPVSYRYNSIPGDVDDGSCFRCTLYVK